MKNEIQNLINVVDATFAKNDIKNASRKVLEELVIHLYDGLNKLNGTYPDWWERDKENDIRSKSCLVRCLPTEQLVDLINSVDEGDLSRAGYPDYILKNNEEGFDAIYDYFQDCYSVIQCMNNSSSRYKIEDKWVIFDRDLTAIYSFSDNETLFEFLPAETIAEMLEQAEIELTITTKRQDDDD